MAIGQSHEVSIGGVEYRVKYGTSSVFEHGFQAPFVERQSVSPSRSEGDYSGDLVFTQSSWAAGEGQKVMRTGGEAGYWYSEDMDVSGASGVGLQLLKSVSDVTGTIASNLGMGSIIMEPGPEGVYAVYPTTAGTDKYFSIYRHDTGDWVTYSSPAYNAEQVGQMVYLRGYMWLTTGTGICRINAADGTGFGTDFNTQNGWISLGTDGLNLFASSTTTVGSYEGSHMHTINQSSDTQDSKSGELEGRVVSIKEHGGATYALANVLAVDGTSYTEQSLLYRYDGSNFTLWKTLPDGFIGHTMRTDGSNLYIGGKQKCDEGNYRGQIYYLTGAASTDSLGSLATFGERDGTSDYDINNIRSHGKSVYFPWYFYGGLGRYDTVNGGISRSYRQTASVAEENAITRIVQSRGDLFFNVKGTNAATDPSKVYKTQSSTFKYPDGHLITSYVDFGLPVSQKLFTKVVIVSPTDFQALINLDENVTLTASYSLDGDTATWGALGTMNGVSTTEDSDSSDQFHKYTFSLPGDGVKAHSLAVKLVMTSSNASNTYSPAVSYVTWVAKPLLNTPGTTEPNDKWKMSLIIADRCRDLAHATEVGQGGTKMANLRTIFRAQEPTDLITYAEPTTTYSALMKSLGEISYGKNPDGEYEATVTVEMEKV